uniref:Uncharacterized protein n=1 Tax=Arundo donax TaxID=35708 RepID=A0A0A9C3N0_ARUDO
MWRNREPKPPHQYSRISMDQRYADRFYHCLTALAPCWQKSKLSRGDSRKHQGWASI